MKQKLEQVYVNINQRWEKGGIVSSSEKEHEVQMDNGRTLTVDKDSPYLEIKQRPGQRFAYGEVAQRLQGEYISFDKLPGNVKDQLVEGREYLHQSTYSHEGALKESTKMVQMKYDAFQGSKLEVQHKRNQPIDFEEAKSYNHKFSPSEFERMVDKKEFIVFKGISNDGELFDKLAYYEPRLNDIRTKTALSENVYLYGEKLTQAQADSLNKGKEVKIGIKSKKHGVKDYMVSYSPKSESFKTKNLEQKEAQKQEINAEKKKSSRKRGIGV